MKREKIIEIKGKNPYEEDLKQKMNLLEAFQTEGAAKEFYKTVQIIFSHYNFSPKRPWFGERRHFLTFTEKNTEVVSLTVDRSDEIIAYYGMYLEEQMGREIVVSVAPAYRIIALDKRRSEGDLSPLEKMPVSISLNGKFQQINYS